MPTGLPIFDYLNAIFRYRLVTACAVLVGLVLTGVVVYSLPDMYQSTTLIMVEPQDVPEAYVKATVTQQLEKRLQAMNQEVLSRTRLEAVIKDFELYPEKRAARVPMEDIVNAMRGKVQLQLFPNDNAFRITYEGGDPATVQRVTARLANMYIDENLRIREEQVTGTTEFMQSELEKASRQLDQLETKVQAFKREFLGELPEQQDSNIKMLEGYRVQLQTIGANLSGALQRKILLEKQASDVHSMQLPQADSSGQAIATSPAARLLQLEAQLAELKGHYTDEHPDVVRTQSLINHLRDELGTGVGVGGERSNPLLPPDLVKSLIDTQLEISRLRSEEDHVKKLIDSYEQRVQNSFGRQQQLEALTRDYDVTKNKYQTLLDKKIEADLSKSLEQRQKAERFRVIDPASLPQSPVRPNRVSLLLVGAAGSFAAALLLPILLWQLDTSFHGVDEVAALAVPVLAVIPQLNTSDVRRQRLRYCASVLTLSVVVLVVGLGTVSLYARYIF